MSSSLRNPGSSHGYYLMGKYQSAGWYPTKEEAERVARQLNYSGGADYRVEAADDISQRGRPTQTIRRVRRNPEFVVIHNPHRSPRASKSRGSWSVNGGRRMKRRSNPALTKLIGKRRYTFGQLLEKNMQLALRGKKRKSFKTFVAARKRAYSKTKRQFKSGYVYHAGLKLRIVGWKGAKALSSGRRRRK